jgi:DNA-binding FadR family transcriptional regulator
MKASGNEVGLTIVRTIHTFGGVMPPLASAASRAALKRTVNAHRAIYDALAARDGEAAGELISTHIHTAWAERKRIKQPT